MLCKRGFSGTVVSQNGYKLPLFNLQIYLINGTLLPDDISFLVSFLIFKYKLVGFYHTHLQSTSYFFIFHHISYSVPHSRSLVKWKKSCRQNQQQLTSLSNRAFRLPFLAENLGSTLLAAGKNSLHATRHLPHGETLLLQAFSSVRFPHDTFQSSQKECN